MPGGRTRGPTGARPACSARTSGSAATLSLETAVAKLTSVPAARARPARPRRLRDGAFADLVVFDPATVADEATYLEPARTRPASTHVVVNGRLAVRDGEETGERPGRLLRRRDDGRDARSDAAGRPPRQPAIAPLPGGPVAVHAAALAAGPRRCGSSSTQTAASSSRCRRPVGGAGRDRERHVPRVPRRARAVAPPPSRPARRRPRRAGGPRRTRGRRLIRYRGDLHRLRIVPARAGLSARAWNGSAARPRTSSSSTGRPPTAGRSRPSSRPGSGHGRRPRSSGAVARHADAFGTSSRPVVSPPRPAHRAGGVPHGTGRLSFSWRLVLAPPEALETVVIHELAHLRIFGHGPRFWALVATRRPDHVIWRRWLHDHATELHGALESVEQRGRLVVVGRATVEPVQCSGSMSSSSEEPSAKACQIATARSRSTSWGRPISVFRTGVRSVRGSSPSIGRRRSGASTSADPQPWAWITVDRGPAPRRPTRPRAARRPRGAEVLERGAEQRCVIDAPARLELPRHVRPRRPEVDPEPGPDAGRHAEVHRRGRRRERVSHAFEQRHDRRRDAFPRAARVEPDERLSGAPHHLRIDRARQREDLPVALASSARPLSVAATGTPLGLGRFRRPLGLRLHARHRDHAGLAAAHHRLHPRCSSAIPDTTGSGRPNRNP